MTDFGGTYTTGAISVANGGTTVTGTGTFWSPVAEQGDWLYCNGYVGLVASVTDNTHLELDLPWSGPDQSAQEYRLIKMSWLRYEPAITQAKVRALLAYFDSVGLFYFVSGDAPDPSLGDDGQFALKVNGGPWKVWLKTGGEWVLQSSSVLTTDSDISGAGWVLDEDDMASNSATKVPTQQSTKAYVDTRVKNVANLTELAACSLSDAKMFAVAQWSTHPLWVPVVGDFSANITADDPRFVAPSSDPTGATGAFAAVGTVGTGQWYAEDGARIHRVADREFSGDAVNCSGKQVTASSDWLTQFQLSTGRTGGWIQLAQRAVTNSALPHAAFANIAGVQTKDIGVDGLNGIASASIAVNNNTTRTLHAFARYSEAYRMPGVSGGAYGHEIDVVNFAGVEDIDPFTQTTGQTIGVQIAAGAELDPAGQFAVSAVHNVRYNGAVFRKGYVFGYNALERTDGIGIAFEFATGYAQDYYYAAGARSWRLVAADGADGDYDITTTGAGAVSVPRLKSNSVIFPATQVPSSDPNTLDDYEEGTFEPLLYFSSGSTGVTYSNQFGRYTKVGNRVDFTLGFTLTSKGTDTGTAVIRGLPFTSSVAETPALSVRANNMASIVNALNAQVTPNNTEVSIAAFAAGANTTLTDAEFTNTSVIRVSGTYFVD